jgi:hypothetical protein
MAAVSEADKAIAACVEFLRLRSALASTKGQRWDAAMLERAADALWRAKLQMDESMGAVFNWQRVAAEDDGHPE